MTTAVPPVVHEYLRRAIDGAEPAALSALLHPDFVNHEPGPFRDATGLKTMFEALHRTFADLRFQVAVWVVEDNTAACRGQGLGRHVGTYRGNAPTGRQVRFDEMHVYRVRDGLISERWCVVDVGGLIAQLEGRAEPPPPAVPGEAAHDGPGLMGHQAMRQLVLRYYEQALNRDAGQIAAFLTDDYVNHDGAHLDRDAFQAGLARVQQRFPGLGFEPDLMLVDGDLLFDYGWTRFSPARGARGRPGEAAVAFQESHIYRCRHGAITERWWVADTLAMYPQLAAVRQG